MINTSWYTPKTLLVHWNATLLRLFIHLETAQMDVMLDVMAPRNFNTGEALMKQGDPGEFFYVLDEGTCDVTILKEGVSEKVRWQSGSGTGVGEMHYFLRFVCTVVCYTVSSTTAAGLRATFN